jgi:hypothetical protein
MCFHQCGEVFIYRQRCEEVKPEPPPRPCGRARFWKLGLSKAASLEPVSSEAARDVVNACGTESAQIDDPDERHLARHPHHSYQAQLPQPHTGHVIRLPSPVRIRR